MKVEFHEVFETTDCSIYDIDINKYKKWLNGRESNDDLLLDYIVLQVDNDPIDTWEDGGEFITSYIGNNNNIHKIING